MTYEQANRAVSKLLKQIDLKLEAGYEILYKCDCGEERELDANGQIDPLLTCHEKPANLKTVSEILKAEGRESDIDKVVD